MKTSGEVAHIRSGLVGGASSVISLLITYPLYQAVVARQSGAQHGQMLHVLSMIVRAKGFVGLYAGVMSALIATGVQSTVYYFWYSFFRSLHRVVHPLGHMLAGVEAGWATVLMTNPLWVVTTRQMTDTKVVKTGGWWATVTRILAAEGVGGLFSGVSAALILCINPGLQFCTYEFYMWQWYRIRRVQHTSLTIFVIAGLAKITATVLSYPLQVLKTELQRCRGELSTGGYSTMNAIRNVLKERGMMGFYAGLQLKLWQTALTAACTFVSRDAITHSLHVASNSL